MKTPKEIHDRAWELRNIFEAEADEHEFVKHSHLVMVTDLILDLAAHLENTSKTAAERIAEAALRDRRLVQIKTEDIGSEMEYRLNTPSGLGRSNESLREFSNLDLVNELLRRTRPQMDWRSTLP